MVVANKVCTITTCNPQPCGLVWQNQPRPHKIESFLGCTWLAWATPCALRGKRMLVRGPHVQLGPVKQPYGDFYPNTAGGLAADRASLQRHFRGACDSIDLGGVAREDMPNGTMAKILPHLTKPVVPHYQNLDGWATPYFLRLFGPQAPTYEIEGELYGGHKCGVLGALTINNFGGVGRQGNWWVCW